MKWTTSVSFEEITKEAFEAYEEVRISGVTNMWDTALVCDLADISKDMCHAVMRDYEKLMAKYPGVRQED